MKNRLEGEPSQQLARATGELEELACGVLFSSIGYRGVAIAGVPFDVGRGVFPNHEGRIVDGENIVPGLYVAGWIKRGPTGIIGTNRADSVATVKSLLTDLPNFDAGNKLGADGVRGLLKNRGIRVVSYPDWQRIDAAEVRQGKTNGKPREKFTRLEEMLAVLDHAQ